ncbi:40S ribosomal protein S30 [Teratosphaeriaceae sp. CCFEE 6253]|nr:40S ribosomal protein S30 [Teratosphaeriaceae sp. CCFEE 6253]
MGKVHGSLARAGKVKSQTPKVGHITPPEPRRTLPSGLGSFTAIFHDLYRGDTCGVEPQEKKKTPKGRAKKRIQYTRRFVNVTMTGGKRKMNPNPTT